MVGVARRYLMTLSQPERRNFESLSRNLASRFSGEQIQIKWLKELENRVKRPDETLADLGGDLLRMAGKAHPTLPRDTQEVLAVSQLFKSLNPETKFKLCESKCATMMDAVSWRIGIRGCMATEGR